MKSTVYNPVLRLLMIALAVFLSWPCPGDCADGQLSATGLAPACFTSAAGIAAPDDCDHGCGCPCLSDSVKVQAQRPIFMPLPPVLVPVALLEPARPRVIVLPFRVDVLSPALRPVASSSALRAPPLV